MHSPFVHQALSVVGWIKDILFATPRYGVKRREKRKRGPLREIAKRRMNRRKRPIDSNNPARCSPNSDNSRTTERYCWRNESDAVCTSVSVAIMRGNVGSFTVAYAIFFTKAFQAIDTIALNNRFITRKRPFINSTTHFYVAFCPTLMLIPWHLTASFM